MKHVTHEVRAGTHTSMNMMVASGMSKDQISQGWGGTVYGVAG